MLAGSQGGKTSFGPHWLNREIHEKGGGDYLAATASFDLFKLKMLPETKELFEHVMGIGRYWAGDMVMEIRDPATGKFLAEKSSDKMWGRIILRSAQAEGGLESATAKAAWLDEAGMNKFRIDNWEAVLRRLSLSQGRVLITTTLYNRGWIKTELYDKWKKGDPSIEVIQFPSFINPAFPKEEYERAQRDLPRWKFNMFYKGEFDLPAGLIYDNFDEEICIEKPFEIPQDWPRYVGHDFGGVNLCGLFYAEEKVNEKVRIYHLYREFLGGMKSIEDHVRYFKNVSRGEHIVKRVGGAKSEEQWRRDFASHGWPISEPPIADVETGINRVYSMHAQNQIKVFNTCKGYLDEKRSYSRKVGQDGQITEQIEDKETYHRMDAERYIMSDLNRPSAEYVRFA